MRRYITTPSAALTPNSRKGLLTAQQATYTGPVSIFITALGGWCCTVVGAQWGHSFYNLAKHGRFRVRMELDNDGPTVNRPAQFAGGTLFFLCWWFFWGPRRFKKFDLGKVQPQWGPF